MNPEKADASVGQLLGALASDTSALVRQELQLASAEMTQKARHVARNAGVVAAGGLSAAAEWRRGAESVSWRHSNHCIQLWAAAGIVAVVLAAISVFTMHCGLRALRELDPLPEETLSSLQPDRVASRG
jgi:hypothetical protein